MSIRSYQAQDKAAVIALWQALFPDDPPWNEPAAIIAAKLTVQPELFLVSIEDDRLTGTVLAGFDGVRGWIHKLAVEPDSQSRGTGSQLMAAAEAELAALGCCKVNLQVRASNAAVVDFYTKAGYQEEQRVNLGKLLDS